MSKAEPTSYQLRFTDLLPIGLFGERLRIQVVLPQLLLACTNINSGAPLYSTTTPLVPSVLGSSDDLQGTKYNFSCTAQVVGQ
jgi:hypothetical protein